MIAALKTDDTTFLRSSQLLVDVSTQQQVLEYVIQTYIRSISLGWRELKVDAFRYLEHNTAIYMQHIQKKSTARTKISHYTIHTITILEITRIMIVKIQINRSNPTVT
jgi:hypothetical protein